LASSHAPRRYAPGSLRKGCQAFYRSRGKGRGTPSRRYGNRPHAERGQGLQERLRRVRGGWAWSIRMSGLTKNAALDEVNKHRRDVAAYTLLTGERLAV
jgi:hypothetical protein